MSLWRTIGIKNDLNNNHQEQLLHNPHISSSEKISLINHDDVLKKWSRLAQLPTFTNATGQSKHILLSAIQSKYRPQACAVLDFILEHPDEVTWDPNTFEVKIRGIVLDDANIRDILLTLMNAVPMMRHIDIPPGTYELYDKLLMALTCPKVGYPQPYQVDPPKESSKAKWEKEQIQRRWSDTEQIGLYIIFFLRRQNGKG